MENFKWGVIGCGNIARKFAEAVAGVEGTSIVAATDKVPAAAAGFARDVGAEKVYETHHELVRDTTLDAVYIATVNTTHYALIKDALNAGRNVLCEKPFTMSARETGELIGLARAKGHFLMEGLWTKTLPIYGKIREIVSGGVIGDVKVITGDYFFRATLDPNSRLFNPALGGGAIMDIGIYLLTFTSMFLGSKPSQVFSTAETGSTGVDEQVSMILKYENGAMAVLVCSIRTPAPQKATIIGTKGRIEVVEFGRAQKATLYTYGEEAAADNPSSSGWAGVRSSIPEGGEVVELSYPFEVNGFEYEVREVMNAIRSGKTESDLVLLDDTLNIIKIIEQAKASWR